MPNKLTKIQRAMPEVRRALRRRVRMPEVVAALVVSTGIKPGRPPGRGRQKAGGRLLVSQRRAAQSIAVRNATVRWTRIFTEGAGAVLLVLTTPVSPVYLALAGLVIIGQLLSLSTIDLDERYGAIIYTMWRRHGYTIAQAVETLLPEVNAELRELGKPRMGKREIRAKAARLVELGCVTPSVTPDRWRLKDKVWVRI